MPNIVSAKKRVQVAKIKTLRNNMIKSSYKSAIRKFEEALLTKDLNLVETNKMKWLYNLTIPEAIYETSGHFTYLPMPCIIIFLILIILEYG